MVLASWTPAGGSRGRIRIEAYNHQFTGTISGAGTMRYATVGLVQLPESAPSLRVVSIGGVGLPLNPTGSYDPADLEISQDGDVTFEIEARNVPVGTVVKLQMVNETQGVINFTSEPLAGTEAQSTAVATTNIPHGFSRFSMQASW